MIRICGGQFDIWGGGQKPQESQGTGKTTNKFVLCLLKSEIIRGVAAPRMSATDSDIWEKTGRILLSLQIKYISKRN